MTGHKPLLILAALALIHAAPALAAEGGSQRIKKCQDAKGVWHYGDTADEACTQSKVTVIDNKGLKRNEIAAPPTEAELRERERNKAKLDAERKVVEDQAKRDQTLLATYGHEDDINLARDRKLSMIDAQIATSEATISTLRATLTRMQERAEQDNKKGGNAAAQSQKEIERAQMQINQQETYIAARRKEQEQVKRYYAEERKRYLELKNKAPAPAAQAAPATATQ